MSQIAALIVNYATPQLVLNCVASILHHRVVASAHDIVVIENASPDDSSAILKGQLVQEIKLIQAEKNGGFSSGINIGLPHTESEYVLVLNPDTYFLDQSIELAIKVLEAQPQVGVIGLDLVNPDGSRQYSARRFYSVLDIVGRRSQLSNIGYVKHSVDEHMMRDAWIHGEPFDADWVMGTGFIIRRELFCRLGGMNEEYFLYMEDVDLCARVWKAGYRVMACPNARLVHDHQRASANIWSRSAQMHMRSLRRFMRDYRIPLLTKPGVKDVFRR